MLSNREHFFCVKLSRIRSVPLRGRRGKPFLHPPEGVMINKVRKLLEHRTRRLPVKPDNYVDTINIHR